jgi:hypothetical protein
MQLPPRGLPFLFLTLATTLPAQTPVLSKEFIRLGDRIIATENAISITPANISAGSSGVTISCCVVASADFNEDGVPDLVWQSPTTGAAQIWYMGGSGGATITGSATISSGNSWHIVGAADFNADGHPDLVWQNPTSPNAGAAQIWYMGGTNGATFLSAADVSSGNSWRIVTAAKYPITISGSASNAYLVWEDPVAGAVQFWYESTSQSSPQLLSAVTVSASTPWRVVADADFNGDGIPDAVWQNPSTGAVEIWLMGGSQGATYMSTAQVTEANTWHVVAAADFNGNGIADLLWENTSNGALQIWYMTPQ